MRFVITYFEVIDNLDGGGVIDIVDCPAGRFADSIHGFDVVKRIEVFVNVDEEVCVEADDYEDYTYSPAVTKSIEEGRLASVKPAPVSADWMKGTKY